jgi:undecaprenyl pyrophosphate phosphatase UppP
MADQNTKPPVPAKPAGPAAPYAPQNTQAPAVGKPTTGAAPTASQNTPLPTVGKSTEGAPASGGAGTGTAAHAGAPLTVARDELSNKEVVIAVGALLAAMIVFVIVKNYISKMLVASYKKSPRSADMAGWSLFCILLIAAVMAVLGVLDSLKFFSMIYLISAGVAIMLFVIMFFLALSSKR